MDLAGIDRALAQLRQTVATMSTNLVELENDTGRARLDQAPLAGATAARWSEARAALALLWQWFAQLNELVDKAAQLRASRARLDAEQLRQLDWLVNGPSIELSTSGVPLAERGLLGPAETSAWCSPPQLLDRMRAAFDQVVVVVANCNQKWATLEARLAPLGERLAQAEQLAAAVGDRHRPELKAARTQLDQLRQAVMTDPLGASDSSAEAIATSLDSAAADLRRLGQVRDNLAAQLNQARALMAELRAATSAAADAAAQAQAKIAHPAVVAPPAIGAAPDRALEAVEDASARGDWRAATNLLTQWTTRQRDALADANRALAANRAPVAARDELRGRLDAYRAKAHRLGRLEDPRLAAIYARAKDVLFTAPTDLAEAEQLVLRYQQAVGGPAPREVAT